MLQRASDARCEEEGNAALDHAMGRLSSAGFAFADEGGVGAEAAVEIANSSLDTLLDSLRVEPATNEDRAARFSLYERHAETVSTVRSSLLRFWEDAREEVNDAAPRAAIDKQIKDIDCRANLELYEERRCWFVYSMARAVARNEAIIQAVLKDIRARLSLLAAAGVDCPICLEAIPDGPGESVALGCAHKLHADCWTHWSAHCESVHKTPFCPTCRKEEFLDEIL